MKKTLYVSIPFDIINETEKSTLYFQSIQIEVNSSPLFIDLLNIYKNPKTIDEGIENGYLKEVLSFCIENKLLIPSEQHIFFDPKNFRLSNPSNFTKFIENREKENSLGLIGCPVDFVSTSENNFNRTLGPKYVRQAINPFLKKLSLKKQSTLFDYELKKISELSNFSIFDFGDIPFNSYNENRKDYSRKTEMVVSACVKSNITPLIIGGDHSITYDSLRSLLKCNKKINVIHFDAHSDMYMSKHDSNLNHANVFGKITSDLNPNHIIQIGVREFHLSPINLYKSNNISHISVLETNEKSVNEIYQILDKDIPLYISFDIDVMDNSVVSCTGTYVPGGMDYDTVLAHFNYLTKTFNICGLDFVELTSDQPNNIGGKIISNLITRLLINSNTNYNSQMNYGAK